MQNIACLLCSGEANDQGEPGRVNFSRLTFDVSRLTFHVFNKRTPGIYIYSLSQLIPGSIKTVAVIEFFSCDSQFRFFGTAFVFKGTRHKKQGTSGSKFRIPQFIGNFEI